MNLFLDWNNSRLIIYPQKLRWYGCFYSSLVAFFLMPISCGSHVLCYLVASNLIYLLTWIWRLTSSISLRWGKKLPQLFMPWHRQLQNTQMHYCIALQVCCVVGFYVAVLELSSSIIRILMHLPTTAMKRLAPDVSIFFCSKTKSTLPYFTGCTVTPIGNAVCLHNAGAGVGAGAGVASIILCRTSSTVVWISSCNESNSEQSWWTFFFIFGP